MRRVRPSTSLIFGRVAWKSKKSSGSMRAKRVAPRDEPRNCSAAEAASPASFHPVNAHTSAGARRPSGRCSQMRGCIRLTVHHAFVPSAELHAVPAPPIAVATMRAGDEVTGVFACTRKDRLIARTGTAYLALELRDRTGAIAARVFRDADLHAGRFEQGDLVRVAVRRTPCTRNGHHAYLGGLLEHTVAVATLAVETCTLHPRLDQDLLLTAAIVHDLGKTREFTLGAEIGLTEEGRLLGHVELGLRMLEERAALLDEPRRLALAHCVLTHHGDRRPATPEALALQRINALDASVKGA